MITVHSTFTVAAAAVAAADFSSPAKDLIFKFLFDGQ